MALFSEGQPGAGSSSSPVRARRSAAERRTRTGWILLGVAMVSGLVLGIAPSPYVIEQPGPVFDTLGTADHEGEERPLIVIPDETTYPTDGELNLLTVSVVGNRETRPNWFEVLSAWSNPEKAVLPLDSVFPPNVSTADREQANQAAMVNSQQDAIAAALVALDIDFPRSIMVQSISEGSPAVGIIEPGDEILAVNDEPRHDVGELRSAVAANGDESPASVTVQRGDETLELEVTPVMIGQSTVLGVNVAMEYELPIDVQIQLDRVGGPSAGMMFALGIMDKLTPDSLTGGENWAGTGTIDSSGVVGPIGGIRQKLFGAQAAGSEWFLAPQANCDEVVGHVPDGLTVFAVETLDQAREAVETVSAGADFSGLPTCALPASAP